MEAASFCPGLSATESDLSVSGSIDFQSNLSYSSPALTESFTLYESVPGSCLGTRTCADLSAEYQSMVADPTTGYQSASCTGSSTCSCTIAISLNVMGNAGTYQLSGDSFTTTDATTGETDSPSGYCVQGKQLHVVDVDTTMNMGPMGQATIVSDIIAMKP